MGRSLTIKIPQRLPKILSPNRKYAHHGTVTKGKTAFQQTVFAYARDAMNRYCIDAGKEWEPLDKAVLIITVVIRDNRYKQDDDNVIATLKAGRDVLQTDTRGKIQGVGIIKNDRDLRVFRPRWKIYRHEAPMIILEIHEVITGQEVPDERIA
jgi:hypothetical protein